MRLYTYHSLEYDPTTPLDLSKCTAAQIDAGFKDKLFTNAYAWLHRELKTTELTWCYADLSAHHMPLGHTETRYTLEVPEDKILAKLSSTGWWFVHSNTLPYPEHFYNLEEPAFSEATVAWEQVNSKDDTWRKHVFGVDPDNAYEIIIPNPIPPEWIVEKVDLTGYEPLSELYRTCLLNNSSAHNWYRSIRTRWEKTKPWDCYVTKEGDEWTFHIGTESQKQTPYEKEFLALSGLDKLFTTSE